MKKINYIQLIKIGIGSCIAILVADRIGLNYSASAGVITLLSIQNTKKETLFITLRRFIAFGLSLLISYTIFHFMGYHAYSFGFFLLAFVGACYLLKLEDGISMNAVLATHFLIEESMSLYWIRNEISLLLIGAGIGILLNLYIPKKIMTIKQDQVVIEEEFKIILNGLSKHLLGSSSESSINDDFLNLDLRLKEALARAYENMNNTLLSDTRYYIQYMQMRKGQSAILRRIYSHILNLDKVTDQAYKIADYMNHIAATFHEYNNAMDLLYELQDITLYFKSNLLPISRSEFENRAILYQIMNELESFLLLKREFVDALTETQIENYWREG